jgi:hypothetical protein
MQSQIFKANAEKFVHADPHDYGGAKESSTAEFLAALCVRSLFPRVR